DEAPVKQQAPIAVAEREREARIAAKRDDDLALIDERSIHPETDRNPAVLHGSAGPRTGRESQRCTALDRGRALQAAGGAVVGHQRRRDHRSTSPNTISIEARIAQTSASMCPLQRKSMACKCA